jgi:hypothetical protein
MYASHKHHILNRGSPDVDLSHSVLLLHFDFAENFKCVAQDQIQAAFYGQKQVSLMTVVAVSSSGTACMVLVSDSIDHGKEFVTKYLLFLFEVSVYLCCTPLKY